MQINLTGHHIEISDALRSYVNDKLERLERHELVSFLSDSFCCFSS